jgi:hypothetical protein
VLAEQPRLNDLPAPGMLFGRGLRLLQETESRRYAIFLGPVALFEWTEDDRATRRLVAAQVVNARLATRVEVARVFGLHVNTVSRIAQRVAAEGVTASIGRKRGPHGPFKVTAAVVAKLRQAVDDGLTERAAQRQLQQCGALPLPGSRMGAVAYAWSGVASSIAMYGRWSPQLLDRELDVYSSGAMTYDLRRLRLHGLIQRVYRTRRRSVTHDGWQIAKTCSPPSTTTSFALAGPMCFRCAADLPQNHPTALVGKSAGRLLISTMTL